MGVAVEDYFPIYVPGQSVKFTSALAGPDGEVNLWADILTPERAEVLGTYASGDYSGKPAITINSFGKGKAVYIGADLAPASLARALQSLSASAGVKALANVPAGVEVTVRKSGGKRWVFVLNHTANQQSVNIPGTLRDALTHETQNGAIRLSSYGVRVLEVS
jgi:beta-galactosidase